MHSLQPILRMYKQLLVVILLWELFYSRQFLFDTNRSSFYHLYFKNSLFLADEDSRSSTSEIQPKVAKCIEESDSDDEIKAQTNNDVQIQIDEKDRKLQYLKDLFSEHEDKVGVVFLLFILHEFLIHIS